MPKSRIPEFPNGSGSAIQTTGVAFSEDEASAVTLKARIRKAMIEQLEQELNAILQSAEAAHAGATHEDAVAKSKYDTHGLELSYLAGSQFERARHLETQLAMLKQTKFRDFTADDEIEMGALVVLSGKSDSKDYFLISNLGAGTSTEIDGTLVKVISPESKLGLSLIGLYEGDGLESKDKSAESRRIVSVS